MRDLITCPTADLCSNYRVTAIPANILEYIFMEVTSANTGPFYTYIHLETNIQYTIYEYKSNLFYIFTSDPKEEIVKFYTLTVSLGDEKARQYQASELNVSQVNVIFRGSGDISFRGQQFDSKIEFNVTTPYFQPYDMKRFLLDAFFGFGEGFIDFTYNDIVFHFTKTNTQHYSIHSIYYIQEGVNIAKSLFDINFNGSTILHIIDDIHPVRILNKTVNKIVNSSLILNYDRKTIRLLTGFFRGFNYIFTTDAIPFINIQNSSQTGIDIADTKDTSDFYTLNKTIPLQISSEETAQVIATFGPNKKVLVATADLYNTLSTIRTIIASFDQVFGSNETNIFPYINDINMKIK